MAARLDFNCDDILQIVKLNGFGMMGALTRHSFIDFAKEQD